MKRELLLATGMICLLAARPSEAVASLPKIRVRIGEALNDVRIRGFNLKVWDGAKKVAFFDRGSEWKLHCPNSSEVFLESASGNAKPVLLKRFAVFRAPTGIMNFESRPYRDEIKVIPQSGKCDVVNSVGLETYLSGLINSEFSSSWNEEAIAAQAVAARTYAYHQILKNKEASFDVDATTRDQVYNGSTREDFRATRIVGKTQGLVLTVGGRPIKAFYHSTCGGKTEFPENVWGMKYLGFRRSVSCGYCRTSPRIHWQLDLEDHELNSLLTPETSSAFKGATPRRDWAGIRPGRINPQNRMTQVISEWLVHSGQKSKTIRIPIAATRLRELVGPTRMRSTAYQFEEKRHFFGGRYWHFSGTGNGHGVGMCQMGAKTMGESGFKMRQILKFYYPDVKISKLW